MSSGIIYVPGQGLIKEMFGKTYTHFILRVSEFNSLQNMFCEKWVLIPSTASKALRSMDVKAENRRCTSISNPLNSLISSFRFGSPENLILLYSIVYAIKGSVKHYIQQGDIRVCTSKTVLGVKCHMLLLILILIQLLPLKLPTVFLGWKWHKIRQSAECNTTG